MLLIKIHFNLIIPNLHFYILEDFILSLIIKFIINNDFPKNSND